jgi:UPF0042 nucleotide-binding protein
LLQRTKVVIITGLSGSGKSTAIKALEDVGFFCVDNLPVVLLPKFLELRAESDSEISRLALVMDMRERTFVSSYAEVLDRLGKQGYQFEILFLEASEESLLRRYSQTRMQHPLGKGQSLPEAIRNEREQLEGLKQISDKVIDTSHYNVHELKAVILGHVLKAVQTGHLEIQVLSFGYKYGIPHEADLVIDVRFLPNPYFVPELRGLDGTAPEVQAFVRKGDKTQVFLKKYLDLLDYLIPLYEKEGKSYLTVAVGCTGGRHRSIVIAGEIFQYLKQKFDHANLVHRDIELAIT